MKRTLWLLAPFGASTAAHQQQQAQQHRRSVSTASVQASVGHRLDAGPCGARSCDRG